MRLDLYLYTNKYFKTRTKALQAINRGEVYVNGKQINKPAFDIDINMNYVIEIKAEKTFVSLGGFKLEKALNDFNYNVKNKVAYDIGSSTGGFTDCLIKRDIKKVYAVDLNDELLDETLKNNQKVVRLIKNVKHLNTEDFFEKPDLIVADLSFISSDSYLNVLSNLLPNGKDLILLIKPQFELNEKIKLKNGIIKDKKIIQNVCKKIHENAFKNDLYMQNITIIPFTKNKNKEYLALFKKADKNFITIEDLYKKLWKY